LFGGMRSEEIPAAFGLGCAHYATGTYGISSSTASQTCALRINPQKKIAVAVGINVCQPFYRDFLINKLMNALLPEDATTRADENAADTFSLEELEGTFQGALHNSLDASIENGQLLLRLGHNPSMSSSARNQPIIFVKNNDGHIVPKNDMQFLTTGFFREPRSGSPCLMIGSSAFKKIQPNDTK
jgi:hypothetical protein